MAKPNWLEELVESYFRLDGYITQLHVRFPEMDRELDLLAFNDKKFVIIEVENNVYDNRKYYEKIVGKFEVFRKITDTPKYRHVAKGKKRRLLFVGGMGSDEGYNHLAQLLKKKGIELMDKEDLYKGLLKKIESLRKWPYPADDPSRILYDLKLYKLLRTAS